MTELGSNKGPGGPALELAFCQSVVFLSGCFVLEPGGTSDECIAVKLDIKHVKWSLNHKYQNCNSRLAFMALICLKSTYNIALGIPWSGICKSKVNMCPDN